MKNIFTAIILSIVLFQVPSYGKVNAKMQEFFKREIQKISQTVAGSETSMVSGIEGANGNEMWFLNRFRLYFRASAGFEADGLAQLLVQPEVELLFLRYPAPGWSAYKP
jgi:hypothetical protein